MKGKGTKDDPVVLEEHDVDVFIRTKDGDLANIHIVRLPRDTADATDVWVSTTIVHTKDSMLAGQAFICSEYELAEAP